MTTILFTGGGTSGHLMPIVAVAREIKKQYPQDTLQLHYLGPRDPSFAAIFAQEGVAVHSMVSGKIRRYFSLQNIVDMFIKIPVGFLQSFFLLLVMYPKLVVSKGGSGSAVVCFCARMLFIPVFVHESDSVPGLSNQIVSKWAKKIFTSFPNTPFAASSNVTLIGNPIRTSMLTGTPEVAKEVLHLTFEKPILLFLGGSQGAEVINEFVADMLDQALVNYEIIHSCGKNNYKKAFAESRGILTKELEPYYHLYDSLDESQLTQAYAVASMVISRAGSGSIFEIAAVKKPSMLIPLPSAAGDHQSKNAYAYAATGAAVVIEQENLTHNFVLGVITNILLDQDRVMAMQQAAGQFAKPQAAAVFAKEILSYIKLL